MQLTDKPSKIALPFANAGGKRTIPVASQIGVVAGAASFTDGFPPLTRTDLYIGGIPPSGLDMNGVLFDATSLSRWQSAGGGFPFDSAFVADVGGYPKGAKILRSDGVGYWLNTVDNNSTDPESGGTGWVSDFAMGEATVAMSGANVTLTALQAAHPIIRITGTLTTNLQLFFPAILGEWLIINDATGAFTVTAKTATGTGVAIATATHSQVYGDGANIVASSPSVTSQSLTTNGYRINSDGFIEQWGTVTASISADTAVVFPIAFPNALFSITGQVINNPNNVILVFTTESELLTGFTMNAMATSGRTANTVMWRAIGY